MRILTSGLVSKTADLEWTSASEFLCRHLHVQARSLVSPVQSFQLSCCSTKAMALLETLAAPHAAVVALRLRDSQPGRISEDKRMLKLLSMPCC